MEENSNKIFAEDLTSTQINEIQRKRTEEGTKREEMIASDDGVIDVVDLINNSGNGAIAIRVKTLLENGVTEEMLKSKYMDISAGVTDKNIALGNLRTVCDMYIRYVSEQANGIVINPITGEVDQRKSLASAIEYGIISSRDVVLVDPLKMKYEAYKEDSFFEILNKSKLLTIDEKEFSYWDYNRRIGEAVNSSKNSQTDWTSFKYFYEELANKTGMSNEEIKVKLNKLQEFDFSSFSVEEIDFFMKCDFFNGKDTHIKPEFLNKVLGKYNNVRFFKNMLNEKGELDLEKIRTTIDELIVVMNEKTLIAGLEKYNDLKGDISLEALDDVNKANLYVLLARGVLTEDAVGKAGFEELCQRLGISPKKEEIMKIVGANNEHRLKEIATEGEVTKENFRKVMSDLKISKQMTPAEKMIYEITENRNLHISDEREAIARLYMMYCEKAKEYDLYSMQGNICKEIAKAFERYMLDKKEYFSEYLTFTKDAGIVNNRITYAHVKKVIGDKEPSKKTKFLMESTPKKIDRKLEALKGEDSKISQKEFDDFFATRSEDLAIAYEKEFQERKEIKKAQIDKFTQADLSNTRKLNLYKAETVDDVTFAQVALFCKYKSYKVNPEDIKDKLFKYRNSKFYQTVLNENDEVDFAKLEEFSKTYIEEFNRGDLRKETVKYLLLTKRNNVKIEELDEVNKKNLQGVLARGYLTDDVKNKRAFKRLCENLGIETDLESILKVTGCEDIEDLEEIKEDQEINSLNYREKLSERRTSKKMSLGEKRIFEITEDIDLYVPKNAEIIAREYVKYNEKIKELPENSPEAKTYKEVAAALERVMLENNEKFSSYMTTIRNGSTDIKNKIEYAYVKKVLDTQQTTNMNLSLANYVSNNIEQMINSLRDENGQISKEDHLRFFEERTENNAQEYKKAALKRLRDKNKQLTTANETKKTTQKETSKARQKENKKETKKEQNTEEKKPNAFVSWVKKTATSVRDSIKKLIKSSKEGQLDVKETKLLDEPKERRQVSEKQNKNEFVPTVATPQIIASETSKNDEEKKLDISNEMEI